MANTEPGKELNEPEFYQPDMSPDMEAPDKPRESRFRKVAKPSWIDNPFVRPGLIILVFLIVLASVGGYLQRSRLKTIQHDFETLIAERCTEFGDASVDFGPTVRALDSIADRAARTGSGPFALLVPSAGDLEEKAREISKALTALGKSSPGPARHNALVDLEATVAKSGVAEGRELDIEPWIKRNHEAWEQKLRAEARTLPQDGRNQPWTAWLAELEAFKEHARDKASSISHKKLSDHLDMLDVRWQRGSRFEDYGESFAGSFFIYDKLRAHRCPFTADRDACRDRWDALCGSLFDNWAEDVRERNSRGEDISEISRQFNEWEEQASRFGDFLSAKLSVDRYVVASEIQ